MINWGNFWGFFSTGIPSEILYPSLWMVLLVIVIGWGCKGIKNKVKFVLWVLLFEYLFVVVCSTIICRGAMSFEFERLELKPFWTYMAVMNNTPGVSVWDIVLNVALFVPLGFLVKLLYPSISLIKMLLIGILSSVVIETNQYCFEKGIAQFDDVMHNTMGAVIGWSIAMALFQIIDYLVNHNK